MTTTGDNHEQTGDAQPVLDGWEATVRAWLAEWGAEVAARDFDAAERRFHHDVVGFGTRATIATGLAELRANQWQHVWPNIDDFAFDADGATVWVSPDGLLAVIGGAWTSSGRTADGERFPRNGRVSVVLTRADAEAAWSGVHTHFSRDPDGPGTYTG